MGQFAKDWTELKTIIKQKDDAIDKQAAEIAALQKQLAAQTPQLLDGDDQKAVAELRQTVGDNAPAAAVKAAASTAPAAAATPALSHAAAPAHPPATPVTTFKK